MAKKESSFPKPGSRKMQSMTNLVLRNEDQFLDAAELRCLALVAEMEDPDQIERAPPRAALRRYRQGDLVFRQGAPGASAFYFLTAADLVSLRQLQLQRPHDSDRTAQLRHDLEAAQSRTTKNRQVATAVLLDNPPLAPPQGFFSKLLGGSGAKEGPKKIPIDAPVDIDYPTRSAPLLEGDLFSESSCLHLAPRAVTVSIVADCFALEFLGGFLRVLKNDPGFRRRQDEAYRRRSLGHHLRRSSLLASLDERSIDQICAAAEMLTLEPGEFLSEQGADVASFFVVRSGNVQEIAGASVLVSNDEVQDWKAFCGELADDADAPTDPADADNR